MRILPEQMIQHCRAAIRARGQAPFFSSLLTDSRQVRQGGLFFALTGPHFDGHHFVNEALQKGAAGAVIRKGKHIRIKKGHWLFAVEDPLWALGTTASNWRHRFRIPIIGITGSNGKTTTKEWIAAILASRYRVLKTEGNYNNLIGLPLTLSNLSRRHEAAVLEMGMSAPGEIDRLAEIAAPQIGVITNIARAHLVNLRTIASVVKAKGELIARLPPEGLAVLNADDERVLALARKSRASVVSYGFSPRADIRGSKFKSDPIQGTLLSVHLPHKTFRVRLTLPGRHNASNALAAITVGHHFRIPPQTMARALRETGSLWGRMERIRLRDDILIVNDAYNANPDSMLQALETMAAFKRRRRLALLGDMLELGSQSRSAHREVGMKAAHEGISELLVIGDYAADLLQGARHGGLAAKRCHHFHDHAEAVVALKKMLKKKDLLLVKGSRGMKLEIIIKDLQSCF